jgi:hypothetical protein
VKLIDWLFAVLSGVACIVMIGLLVFQIREQRKRNAKGSNGA